MTLTPIVLDANQPPERFYAGGERIAAFRGAAASEPHTPEDWVASTVALFGTSGTGETTIGGRALSELVRADPGAWLGAAHAAVHADDTQLLVKLLDAGERLPVHAHPDDIFARDFLGHTHGKAEAWYIVEPGEVFLGFTRDVSREELDALVRDQDVSALSALLHRRRVQPDDTVFVPAGLPHAIGSGVFLVEVQQPEDLSILMEWRGFDLDGAADGHLGLGFDLALNAVHRAALTSADVDALISRDHASTSALVPPADAYFRVDRVSPETTTLAGYGVLVVLDGVGELRGKSGPLPLARGSVVLLPHAAGEHVLTGTARGVLCRPPAV
ncbi:mannose-6-phosphate isomerase [Microbacterium trichothecenolyticum]|uniref:class I mannose-6-phosphate isomerase n=1 Tax=Microbacterium trichothecenolyticum TaxID=69370 RepID=UPI00285731B8|nr:class I mannose-6-phosphate isomerase [Microbacterium trichothecenolyticum]MDR7184584.1 mannose-6-phosphate isomerase [Microbacterium trichothecenolyticum]